jgi:uncharacterized membrane protein YhaH (DUF805 family)
MMHYLFSFSGRINRAKLWLFLLIILIVEMVGGIALVAALGPQHIADVVQRKAPLTVLTHNPAAQSLCAVLGLVLLALLFAGFAVIVKRLHDRNKSAWWLLVFYVLPLVLNIPRQMAVLDAFHSGKLAAAIQHGGQLTMGGPVATIAGGAATIISLWAFVELYILRGTVGDNRYGPDPLAGRG